MRSTAACRRSTDSTTRGKLRMINPRRHFVWAEGGKRTKGLSDQAVGRKRICRRLNATIHDGSSIPAFCGFRWIDHLHVVPLMFVQFNAPHARYAYLISQSLSPCITEDIRRSTQILKVSERGNDWLREMRYVSCWVQGTQYQPELGACSTARQERLGGGSKCGIWGIRRTFAPRKD